MRTLFKFAAAALVLVSSQRALAAVPLSVRDDIYTTTPCLGFTVKLAQVKVVCRPRDLPADLSALSRSEDILNRYSDAVCNDPRFSGRSLPKSATAKISPLIEVINDNAVLAATALKQCDVLSSVSAQLTAIKAYQAIKRITNVTRPQENTNDLTRDDLNNVIDKLPLSKGDKTLAKFVNTASDQATWDNIQKFGQDFARDPVYTVVSTAVNSGTNTAFGSFETMYKLMNSMTPGPSGPTLQEQKIFDLLDNKIPSTITNHLVNVLRP